MEEVWFLLNLRYIQSANKSRWLISRMQVFFKWSAETRTKYLNLSQNVTFSERNRNKPSCLYGRCYISVFLTDIYFAWKQACHFHTAFQGFFISFVPLSSIYWWKAVRRAFCVIALSVKQSDPLLQHLLAVTPTYSYSYAVSYLLLSGLWIMCLLLRFLPVFAHHWLVIFHLLSYTVITVPTCASMIENEKYVPSLQYLTLFVLKEFEDYSNHNIYGVFF